MATMLKNGYFFTKEENNFVLFLLKASSHYKK